MSQSIVRASSQGLSTNTPPASLVTRPLTFSIWFKATSFTTNNLLLSINSPTDNGVYLLVQDVGGGVYKLRAVSTGPGSPIATSTNVVTTGAWHHAVAIWSGNSDRRVFLDNVKNTDAVADQGLAAFTRMGIGCFWNGTTATSNWDGLIAFPTMYPFALSDSQVAALYYGYSPKIAAGRFEEYWPLCGNLNGIRLTTATLTNQGVSTVSSDNPRIFGAP